MLEEIRIRDLGVIDEAQLELGAGLTVLTGETGAGKTMVLTALGMVLGEKVDASLVRHGAERAVCAARFLAHEELVRLAERDHGADTSEGLVLARMLSAEGRSRSLLSGASVPAATLASFGEELISIHGQGSASRLLRPAAQRSLLDQFAGDPALELRESHRVLYHQVRELDARIEQLSGDRKAADLEATELRDLIASVEKVQPQHGEIGVLRAELERLTHADALISAVNLAREALTGSESDDGLASVASLLALARRTLELQRDVDPQIQKFANEVIELSVRTEELVGDLGRYLNTLDLDPRRLDTGQTRLGDLQALLRRFQLSNDDEGVAELLQRYSDAGLRLLDLEGGHARLAELMKEREARIHERERVSVELTGVRAAAAERIGHAVTAEVQALAMPHTSFSVRVTPGELGPHGRDEIEFLLAAGAGAAVPVAKGASGGELSRVMLALEVILAQAQPVGTYVFDEVDAGVGGGAAIEVGRRLQRLARHSQVIVVTHLAQVAAFADAHFTVTKNSDGQITASSVARLEPEQRAAELARMMAGLAESERAQASGAELLAFAQACRDNH